MRKALIPRIITQTNRPAVTTQVLPVQQPRSAPNVTVVSKFFIKSFISYRAFINFIKVQGRKAVIFICKYLFSNLQLLSSYDEKINFKTVTKIPNTIIFQSTI